MLFWLLPAKVTPILRSTSVIWLTPLHSRGCGSFVETSRDGGSGIAGSFSKKYFCHLLQKLVLKITVDDLETGGAGVRAQAMAPEGALVQDFHLCGGISLSMS